MALIARFVEDSAFGEQQPSFTASEAVRVLYRNLVPALGGHGGRTLSKYKGYLRRERIYGLFSVQLGQPISVVSPEFQTPHIQRLSRKTLTSERELVLDRALKKLHRWSPSGDRDMGKA